MSQSMYPDNNRNMKRSAGAPRAQSPDPRELQRRRGAPPQSGRPSPAGQRQMPRDHMPPKIAGEGSESEKYCVTVKGVKKEERMKKLRIG